MKKLCPILKDECLESGCHWYVHLLGADPQTGAPVDEWGCAISWIPILAIEISKEVRHSASSVEDFRNIMVKLNQESPLNRLLEKDMG